MAEPIARAVVRDVERELAEWHLDLQYFDNAAKIRDRLVHVVDARIKAGVLRLLEEPVDEPLSTSG